MPRFFTPKYLTKDGYVDKKKYLTNLPAIRRMILTCMTSGISRADAESLSFDELYATVQMIEDNLSIVPTAIGSMFGASGK